MLLDLKRIVKYEIYGDDEDVQLTIYQPDGDTKTSFHNSLDEAVAYLKNWNTQPQ